MKLIIVAFVLAASAVFTQTAYAGSCVDAGTTVDAITNFSLSNTGGSHSPLLTPSAPSCQYQWVHAGLFIPKNTAIYLQANWQGGMALPKVVKPFNPTPNQILQAQQAEMDCHRAYITAEFWVKNVTWSAIPSPVFKQTSWMQWGVWDSATWTCSMPSLSTTVSNAEEVRIAAYASYGFSDGKERRSKVSVYMQKASK